MANSVGHRFCIIFLLIIHTKICQCQDSGEETDEEKCIFLTSSIQGVTLTCGSGKSMYIKQAFYGQYKIDEGVTDSACHVDEEDHCRTGIPFNLYDVEDQDLDLPRDTDVIINGGCTGRKYMYMEYECISDEILHSICDEVEARLLPVAHLKNDAFPSYDLAIVKSCSCIIEVPSKNIIQIHSLTAEEEGKTNNFAIAENGETKYSALMTDMPKHEIFQNGTLLYESEGPIILITVEHVNSSIGYNYYITAQAKEDDQQLNLTCGNAGEVWRKYDSKINPTTTTITRMTTTPTTTPENIPTTTKPTTMTLTTTTEATRQIEDEEMTNNNTGLIAGSITGAVLFILLVVSVAVAIVKCRKKADTDPKSINERYEIVDPTAVTKDTTQHVYSELDPATTPYLAPQPSYVNTTFTLEPGSSNEYEVIKTKAESVKEQGRNDRGVVNDEGHYEVLSYD